MDFNLLQDTMEQQTIIASGINGGMIKAFAGTGKTTTLRRLCEAHPVKRFLYLAFNKGIQKHAEKTFPANTVARTIHSIAWGIEGKRYQQQGRIKGRIIPLHIEETVPGFSDAALALEAVRKFAQSGDYALQAQEHVTSVLISKGKEVKPRITARTLKNAKTIFEKMRDPDGDFPIEHDIYLKLAHLNNSLSTYLDSFDLILLDEAQDLNPVMYALLKDKKVLAVGDPHQAIYGWRGAENVLGKFSGAGKFLLSQSFRFGKETADIATRLLCRYADEENAINGQSSSTQILEGSDMNDMQHMRISRTNAQMIGNAAVAVQHKIPFHFVGGIRHELFSTILAVWGLKKKISELARKNVVCKQFMEKSKSISALKAYADAVNDNDLLISIKLCEIYNIPDLLDTIERRHLPAPDGAIQLYVTAHRAKGLEHDIVYMDDDFNPFSPYSASNKHHQTKKQISLRKENFPLLEDSPQEVNLLYVAITRARKAIRLNAAVLEWLQAEEKYKKTKG